MFFFFFFFRNNTDEVEPDSSSWLNWSRVHLRLFGLLLLLLSLYSARTSIYSALFARSAINFRPRVRESEYIETHTHTRVDFTYVLYTYIIYIYYTHSRARIYLSMIPIVYEGGTRARARAQNHPPIRRTSYYYHQRNKIHSVANYT